MQRPSAERESISYFLPPSIILLFQKSAGKNDDGTCLVWIIGDTTRYMFCVELRGARESPYIFSFVGISHKHTYIYSRSSLLTENHLLIHITTSHYIFIISCLLFWEIIDELLFEKFWFLYTNRRNPPEEILILLIVNIILWQSVQSLDSLSIFFL